MRTRQNTRKNGCVVYNKSNCASRYVNCSERRQSRGYRALTTQQGGLRDYDELDFAALVQEDAQSGDVAYSRQIYLPSVPSGIPGSLGRPCQPIGLRPIPSQGQPPDCFDCFREFDKPADSVHNFVDICQHSASMDLCAWVSTRRWPVPSNGPRC
jgi:hypothetical protein